MAYYNMFAENVNKYLESKDVKNCSGKMYSPVRRKLNAVYGPQLKEEYESIVKESVITKRSDWKNVHKKFEERFNSIVDFSIIDDTLKLINTVDRFITSLPKIDKRKTIDNNSKDWNVVDVYISIKSINGYENALSTVKKHHKDILKYVYLFISETQPNLFERLPYLKVDRAVFTRDFQLVIKLSYKLDKTAIE